MARQRGFTLLEMLLVVFILAALAATTSSMIDDAHDHARFDDNANRIQLVREAIVGRSGGIAGYVADVGQLPNSLTDLIEKPIGVGSYTAEHEREGSRIPMGSGWRGPYLRGARTPADGRAVFPDGWGNVDRAAGDLNFGWSFEPLSSDPQFTRLLTSHGADGQPGPAPLPGVLNHAVDVSEEFARRDHHVDLREFTVEFVVVADEEILSFPLSLRLWYPRGVKTVDGVEVGDLSFRQGDSTDFHLLEGKNELSISFDPDALESDRWLPHGVRAVELRRGDGTLLEGECALVEFRGGISPPHRLNRFFKVTAP